jgi:hypothetical protein
MLKILVALFAIVIGTTAYAASATPKVCAGGQSCDLPTCPELKRTKESPYYGWATPRLHMMGVCRMACGAHPCTPGAMDRVHQSKGQPGSQHMHH